MSVYQPDHICPHGRFSARQADLVKTQLDEDAREPQQFVVLHQFGIVAEGGRPRQAIQTSQVAVVGQADPQVMDFSSKSVEWHSASQPVIAGNRMHTAYCSVWVPDSQRQNLEFLKMVINVT